MPALRTTTEKSLRRLARELTLEREGGAPGGVTNGQPGRLTGTALERPASARDGSAAAAGRAPLSLEQAGALAALESIDVDGAERLTGLAPNVAEAVRWAAERGCPPEPSPELNAMRRLAATLADHLAGVEEALRWVDQVPPREAGPGARIAAVSARAPARVAAVERALAAAHGVEITVAELEMSVRLDRMQRPAQEPACRLRMWQPADEARVRGGVRVLGGRRGARAAPVAGGDHGEAVPCDRPDASELDRWLDALVAAGQYMPFGTWHESSRRARGLLYRLVDQAAIEPGRAAPGADPDAHADEDSFLERYFAHKRLELFRQRPAVAAERLERFQQVRDTIVGENGAHAHSDDPHRG